MNKISLNDIQQGSIKATFDALSERGCYAFIKDLNYIYTYVNPLAAQLAGFDHPEESIGKTDFDLKCDAVKDAPLFQAQDRETIETQRSFYTLDIQPYAKKFGYQAKIVQRIPLHNEKNEIIGVFGICEKCEHPSLLELGIELNRVRATGVESTEISMQGTYILGKKPGLIQLNPLEHELLFFTIHQKSPHTIFRLLPFHREVLEEHLVHLKEKFSAKSLPELADIAIQAGYLNYIPETLPLKKLTMMLKA